jgi:hypothetical protein
MQLAIADMQQITRSSSGLLENFAVHYGQSKNRAIILTASPNGCTTREDIQQCGLGLFLRVFVCKRWIRLRSRAKYISAKHLKFTAIAQER